MKNKVMCSIFALCLCINAIGQNALITMTTTKETGSNFSFFLAANQANTKIQVDFGNGTLVEKIIKTDETYISGTLDGSQTVKIYGTGIISLNCNVDDLTALDVTQNPELTKLYCYQNQLTTLDVSKNTALEELWCNQNQISELNVTQNTLLTELQCGQNKLTELNISNNTLLKDLYCFSNQLTELNVDQNTALKFLFCEHNQLTFATLPVKKQTWTNYSYIPQNPVIISNEVNIGTEIDLSSQYLIDGNTTDYTWKTQNGTILTKGIEYTINSGKTVFLYPQTDIYCEMTNAAFPDFTGSYVLKTTNTKVVISTSIKDIESLGIKIHSYYKTLYLQMPYSTKLSIFNINGSLLLSGIVNSGINTVQLPDTGIYLIELTSNGNRFTKKVFIE